MTFLTGSETISTVGVPTKIDVSFNHGCPNQCRYFPTISTCSYRLSIHIYVKDDEMVTMFATALLGNVDFGPSYLNTIKVP